LINAGQYNWIGFSNSEHLLSYDQFLAWSMRLFGQNHYGLVMHSVLLGTASLPIIFLLGRELGGRYVGLIASALLAISYTSIHFSRILFGTSASFAAILAFYFLFRGLRTRQSLWFALAGIVTGWSLLTYDSSRVLPLIILSLLIWQSIWHRSTFRAQLGNWLILLAGIFIAFGPMLGFALHDFEKFNGRGNSVILWVPEVWQHETATYATTDAFQVVVEQTWRTFLTLHLTGDGSPHFAFPRPMTAPLTAALFVLGLAYCLPRLKDLKYGMGLSWFFLTFIFGGVLTADPPYWPHLNIASPAIALVAALGAERLLALRVRSFGRWDD
jgi:4-amino-4-deoxy-L-arabinose transferase-like glycosyltransferase